MQLIGVKTKAFYTYSMWINVNKIFTDEHDRNTIMHWHIHTCALDQMCAYTETHTRTHMYVHATHTHTKGKKPSFLLFIHWEKTPLFWRLGFLFTIFFDDLHVVIPIMFAENISMSKRQSILTSISLSTCTFLSSLSGEILIPAFIATG